MSNFSSFTFIPIDTPALTDDDWLAEARVLGCDCNPRIEPINNIGEDRHAVIKHDDWCGLLTRYGSRADRRAAQRARRKQTN